MRNIFFDLDGTLLDISEKYYQVYRDFMKSEHQRFLPKNRFWSLKRKKCSNMVLLGDAHLGDRYSQFFIERIEIKKYLSFDKPFEFSLPILRSLRKKGIRFRIVTLRRHRENLMEQLEKFHVRELAPILTSSQSFHSIPPHQLKREIIGGIAHEHDIIIGDTDADILCGKDLGLTTVGVLSGMSGHKILKAMSPDYIWRDIRSLRRLPII